MPRRGDDNRTADDFPHGNRAAGIWWNVEAEPSGERLYQLVRPEIETDVFLLRIESAVGSRVVDSQRLVRGPVVESEDAHVAFLQDPDVRQRTLKEVNGAHRLHAVRRHRPLQYVYAPIRKVGEPVAEVVEHSAKRSPRGEEARAPEGHRVTYIDRVGVAVPDAPVQEVARRAVLYADHVALREDVDRAVVAAYAAGVDESVRRPHRPDVLFQVAGEDEYVVARRLAHRLDAAAVGADPRLGAVV